VQAQGSLFWTIYGEITSNDGAVRTPEQIPAAHKDYFRQSFHTLLDNGIYLAPSAFEVGFLSTVHTNEQLENYLTAFASALRELSA
jgi:glutamate-1-semialdehyde 2,1-aminomutase